MPSSLYIGLMSGTSLDGIDCAVVDFAAGKPRLLAATLRAFAPALRDELLALQASGPDELHRAALAGNALADAYAASVAATLAEAGLDAGAIAAIGMHGQTVRHRPELGYTLQIGNAARLAEASGITVAADFRSRDVAAGGQGAPLVPAFHLGMFGGAAHRAVVNIGGIANLTDLPPGGAVRGWDTGPGNVLMDGWIARNRGQPYDADGAWATAGRVDAALLAALLAEPYCAAPPPKSTGRDLFHAGWLDDRLAGRTLAAEDVQATLLEFTARSIAAEIEREAMAAAEVYVCGGGARNGALMARLTALLAPRPVAGTEALGLHPDWVEATAFAWLARRCLLGQAGNLPAVTGAAGLRVLGAIHPAVVGWPAAPAIAG
ncbi:anhydro-N-acetylmuramic acid kinase [Chitinimonas koreensis]|uniref:anhydro-N-acetylmuramic acid kinase n=1 Tax=Chitinimonas koreensis TaxID=356302 RepID=UPI00042320DC|nr:anhydro-N-acetylmuramic acid kinase [Chitinimonas koreensis]QNM95012.1 anhydro-N-acetylmuramic acid kinase [Chitinimonas koreensis]